jgi:AcrR family transcriptional regulator
MASTQRKPKWRRRADERPDEILDAALDEFTERGFDATRVEDISRRAGLSKAGLYLYFESKEEILRGLIEREIAPIARKMRELADAGADDPLGTLRGLIGAFMTVLSNPRIAAVPRIVLAIAARFPEIGAYYREHVVEEGVSALAVLHQAGVERGVFRACDSRAAARAIMGPMLMQVLWTHVLGGDPGPESARERAEAQIDLLLNGLAA